MAVAFSLPSLPRHRENDYQLSMEELAIGKANQGMEKNIVYTVNIYKYKIIEANGNTGVILTTSKSFSLYWEFL